MSKHNYIPTIDPTEDSEAKTVTAILAAIACVAVFALWGVLLALGI